MLVAPLDWGLGHATRCVPIVRELQRQGCTVLLAAEGRVQALLHAEFPHLRCLRLRGYRIQYAASAVGLAAKIVAQIPDILTAIKHEQAWLKKVAAEEKIDAVISDNRYGLHHPNIPSVMVTHQLRIRSPFAEGLLQRLNYRFLSRFDACWVPDNEGSDNLAGRLSHPPRMPAVPVRYLGALSRFERGESGAAGGHLLVLLSGPEPQRTLFEKMVVNQLKTYTAPVVFVRGLPGSHASLALPENVSVFNHLPAARLEETVRSASFVIARCGYSTVMDLARLQKRSILVPTPGQTEQVYLAQHLLRKNFALCLPQKKFRLQPAIELAGRFPYRFPQAGSALSAVIAAFVASLKTPQRGPSKIS